MWVRRIAAHPCETTFPLPHIKAKLRPMRKLLIFILLFMATLWFLRTPDTDPAAMAAKYENNASRYAERDDGLRVHYRDEGNPDGMPIIFVHGNGGSLHNWEPLVDRLRGDYRIITYTQPGHGLTGPHPRDDYSFSGLAEALDLLINELGLEHFVLGGNSMGGWVAWRYALANPEHISALLLIDASGAPLPESEPIPQLPFAYRIIQNPAGRFIMQHYTPRRLVERTALDYVSVEAVMNEATVDRYWELLRYPGNRRAAALRMITDREAEYAERLSEITAPTLIIWGAEDEPTPVVMSGGFDERLPNAKLVIYEGIGHLPMEEAPDRTALDINEFLHETFDIAPQTP